ncbi:S1 family peptidase [Parafrankia sp. Ea1.12]|uniref:S1 family peptidase n=2 Tax=unclassified Parafrankia TaxID=2994368 RepID=UPI001F1B34AC|nr:S1 family peptidase [Parafrankia sp. Ea1.12]
MRNSRSRLRWGGAGLAMAGFTVIASTIPVYAANSSGDSKATIAVDNAVAAPAADATFATDQVAADLAATSSTIGSKVVSFVQAKGTSYTFGVYADPDLGKVIVETDAPARDVAALLGKDASQVVVRKGKVTDLFSRRDDVPAFWGGAGIRSGGAICSSGYTVANSANTRYQVTAGHCAPNGATEVTELGNRTFGVVSGNGLPSKDMELLGGQSYGSFIYGGGVNSSTGYHVAGAGNPVVGFTNYCHSGRTTGENCGHTAQSVTATVCTSSGCKSPVAAFTGGVLPQGGDSGSPFFVGSTSGTDKHIRGHVIAGNGTTSYAELWNNVAARYGVHIVT